MQTKPKAGLSQVRHIIAVGSGKGGVGKSTVATQLATSLQRLGRRVGLLDADIYGPSQPRMLGAGGRRPQVSPEGHLLPEENHGLKFVSMGLLTGEDGQVIWRAPMVMKVLSEFTDNVAWGELDYLIIDLPPGTGDVQLTLAQKIKLSGAVIVTTPQKVATEIARKGLKMFEKVQVPILGVIENMSSFVCGHCHVETKVWGENQAEDWAKELGAPFLGRIPIDPQIALAGDSGKPSELSPASQQAYAELANALEQKLNGPATTGLALNQAKYGDNGELLLNWNDGTKARHPAYELRLHCACAQCIDETSGARTLDPTKVPADVAITEITPVGHYALGLNFSDGHRTGIYSLESLRAMKSVAAEETLHL